MVGQTVVGRVSDFELGTISWPRPTGTITTMLTGPVTTNGDFEQLAWKSPKVLISEFLRALARAFR